MLSRIVAKQRAIKFFIGMMLPIFALGGFGSIAGLILPYMQREKAFIERDSPRHEFKASIIASSQPLQCGRFTNSWDMGAVVRVERHIGPWKTGEFMPMCLAGDARRLSIKWVSERTLEIKCRECSSDEYEFENTDWGDLHFVYDLGLP